MSGRIHGEADDEGLAPVILPAAALVAREVVGHLVDDDVPAALEVLGPLSTGERQFIAVYFAQVLLTVCRERGLDDEGVLHVLDESVSAFVRRDVEDGLDELRVEGDGP